MSASTVSIAANNAAVSRRRPVLVGERKSNIEALVAEPNPSGVNLGEDKAVAGAVSTAGHSRDLSHHSVRGEASKESMQARRVAVVQSGSVPVRRTRKGVPNKTDKPRWLAVTGIFVKNLVRLLVLMGFIQIIRMLVPKSPEVGTQTGLTEFEGRVAEVERFFKTTAKMIQVQVDVVDRKIETEIDGLKREINERIEDQESALKKLEEKTEGLDKSLTELKSGNWLTKEEFEKFYEQMMKEMGENGKTENAVTLGDLGTYAREIVKNEIEKHASDGLARADYALYSGGGRVVSHSEPFLVGKASNWFLISSQNGVHRDAEKMLKPSFGEPGQCFPLKGSSGFVEIKLRTAIMPEAITLEHVAKNVAYDRSSAPKDCRISGWLRNHDVKLPVDDSKMFLLTEFTYDLEKSNSQTFDVPDAASVGLVDTVRLDFTSNHGSRRHTCIYRLRVHGHEPDSVSMVQIQV